jgi:hypothetical protein
MRRVGTAAATVAVAIFSAASPAWAGFGAVAYDQNSGKYGASWNQPTQSQAFESALRQCASAGCRVHPVEPRGCGALALSDKDKAWGGADRVTLSDAQRAAVLHCQTHTPAGTCTVRISGCNQ